MIADLSFNQGKILHYLPYESGYYISQNYQYPIKYLIYNSLTYTHILLITYVLICISRLLIINFTFDITIALLITLGISVMAKEMKEKDDKKDMKKKDEKKKDMMKKKKDCK